MSAPEPSNAHSDAPARRPGRGRRVARWVLGGIGAVVAVVIAGVLVWSQVGVMAAEPAPVAAVRADADVRIAESGSRIVLAPAEGADGTGLVFIPGAKVDPWAYAAKLSGLVDDGTIVVITKPWLRLALFDLRPLAAFTDDVSGVETWAVGGHSLGGVRACMLAGDADALALFGSYCAADLSSAELPALSLSGSEDGLSTPEKIADAAPLLPADATFTEIAGAAHSSFGDYGAQPGDGVPSIADDEMTADITAAVRALLAR